MEERGRRIQISITWDNMLRDILEGKIDGKRGEEDQESDYVRLGMWQII